jgi:hypothetical protein
MPIDSADSTKLKSDTATDIGEKVLRWFAQIGAAVTKPTRYFSRTSYPASDEKRAESTLEEAGAIAAATENAVLTTTKSFTVPVNAEVKVDTDAQIDSAASTVPDQEEIQRRRDLVRMLFKAKNGQCSACRRGRIRPITEKIRLLSVERFSLIAGVGGPLRRVESSSAEAVGLRHFRRQNLLNAYLFDQLLPF